MSSPVPGTWTATPTTPVVFPGFDIMLNGGQPGHVSGQVLSVDAGGYFPPGTRSVFLTPMGGKNDSFTVNVDGGRADVDIDLSGDSQIFNLGIGTMTISGPKDPRGDATIHAGNTDIVNVDAIVGRGDIYVITNDSGPAREVNAYVSGSYRGALDITGNTVNIESYGWGSVSAHADDRINAIFDTATDDIDLSIGDASGTAVGLIQINNHQYGEVNISLEGASFITVVVKNWSADGMLNFNDRYDGDQPLVVNLITDDSVGGYITGGDTNGDASNIQINWIVMPSHSGERAYGAPSESAFGASSESAPDTFDVAGSAVSVDPYNEAFLDDVSAGIADDAGIAAIIGQLGNVDLSVTFF